VRVEADTKTKSIRKNVAVAHSPRVYGWRVSIDRVRGSTPRLSGTIRDGWSAIGH
jgi:hypothetical protein